MQTAGTGGDFQRARTWNCRIFDCYAWRWAKFWRGGSGRQAAAGYGDQNFSAGALNCRRVAFSSSQSSNSMGRPHASRNTDGWDRQDGGEQASTTNAA